MRAKKVIFICQITENALKVVKCIVGTQKRKFTAVEIEVLPPDADDKKISERINYLFKKLAYHNNLIIISLPRHNATCRYLKVPTAIPQEIEKIVNLQASRYLPYPADELITAYQLISSDREGYSEINLIIVHKNVIERHLNIFKDLKAPRLSTVLSSYGLYNFFKCIKPEEIGSTVMLIDINAVEAELVITGKKNLLFSRSFKIGRQPNWENLVIDEINKTRDVYLKEISKEEPRKIIILGANKASQTLVEILSEQLNLSVELLPYNKKIGLSDDLLNSILNSDHSFGSLIGLGLENVTESLNLLPLDIKEKEKRIAERKTHIQLILFILGIIFILGLAVAKHLDNKVNYLRQLNLELDKIAKEAKPLEEIEKKFKILESQALKKLSALDILYELHGVIPQAVSLVNFSYEEDKYVALRGQALELNSVNAFVSQLQKSEIFKKFSVTLRYAAQKKTSAGEVVDFEINCVKR